jgi:tRNA 2-selenouridine synthase
VAQSLSTGFDTGEHERWIELLLSWYYDPMYDYQLKQKRQRIIACGDADAVREFLSDHGRGVVPDRRQGGR